jgi:hypothetical protein
MIEKFLNDEQDQKAVEKVYTRLVDLLNHRRRDNLYCGSKKAIGNYFLIVLP